MARKKIINKFISLFIVIIMLIPIGTLSINVHAACCARPNLEVHSEAAHPHAWYEICWSCRDKIYIGGYEDKDNCSICNPPPEPCRHTGRVYYDTTHPHAEYCRDCTEMLSSSNYDSSCSRCHTHNYTEYGNSKHPHQRFEKCSCGKVIYLNEYDTDINCSLCHTHSYIDKGWYETPHPHRRYEECACGTTRYLGTTVTVETCASCHVHSYIDKGWYETPHPHKRYEQCACGATRYTGGTVSLLSCGDCVPQHNHNWLSYPEALHPHENYRYCGVGKRDGLLCGEKQYLGTYAVKTNCSVCNPSLHCDHKDKPHWQDPPHPHQIICRFCCGVVSETSVLESCAQCKDMLTARLEIFITPHYLDGSSGEETTGSVLLTQLKGAPAQFCVSFSYRAEIVGGMPGIDKAQSGSAHFKGTLVGNGTSDKVTVFESEDETGIGVYTVKATSEKGLVKEISVNVSPAKASNANVKYERVGILVNEIDSKSVSPFVVGINWNGGSASVDDSYYSDILNNKIADFGNPDSKSHMIVGAAIIRGYSVDGKLEPRCYSMQGYSQADESRASATGYGIRVSGDYYTVYDNANDYAAWSNDTKENFFFLRSQKMTYQGLTTVNIYESYFSAENGTALAADKNTAKSFDASTLQTITVSPISISDYSYKSMVVSDNTGLSDTTTANTYTAYATAAVSNIYVSYYYDKKIVPPTPETPDPDNPEPERPPIIIDPEEPIPEPEVPSVDVTETQSHYKYRPNKEVVTSFKVTNNTNNYFNTGVTATLNIAGDKGFTKVLTTTALLPKGGSQLVWFKWTTPSEEQNATLTLTITDGVTIVTPTKTAEIAAPPFDMPPDTKPTDRNPGWYLQNFSKPQKLNATWGEWQFNNSQWTWKSSTYSIVSVTSKLTPHERAFSAFKNVYGVWNLKSGYGFNNDVSAVTTRYNPNVTDLQSCISLFPEFDYKTYARTLELNGKNSFHFAENEYSRFSARIHFTPIWYPDKKSYPVKTLVFDLWTPVGELYNTVSDNIWIDGNVYDDWDVVGGD